MGLEFADALLNLARGPSSKNKMSRRLGGLCDTLEGCKSWVVMLLTKACAVENPIPPRFTPVTSIVLPRIPLAKALATSKASVLSLNSGCVVPVILMLGSSLLDNVESEGGI